jgi:hypothetical protein
MTPEKFKEISDDTLQGMKEHVGPFLSPIWKYKFWRRKDILSHGSGTYIEKENKKFIITAEHVAKHKFCERLTHSFCGNDKILVLRNKFVCKKHPVDVAISKINNSKWQKEVSQGNSIPLNRFNQKHDATNGELLFFAGFSGERSKVLFKTVISRGTAYLTQECKFPQSVKGANPTYHLSIHYPPDLAHTLDPQVTIPLPNPHGFSGSLLWNTKRVECLEKKVEWDPSMAKVTGIIWAWPSSEACILATKVEYLELEAMIEDYDNF